MDGEVIRPRRTPPRCASGCIPFRHRHRQNRRPAAAGRRAPRGASPRHYRRDAARLAWASSCRPIEAIETSRVVTEDVAFPLCRGALDDPIDNLDPLRVGAGKLQDMPIAAIHDAIEAESFDRMGNVGSELLAGPIPMVGFGRNAGNLAMHIRQGREFLEVLAPGIEYAGLDRGLADMIEDEADFRT